MSKEKNTIIIFVEGGIVHDVECSDLNTEVLVVDKDSDSITYKEYFFKLLKEEQIIPGELHVKYHRKFSEDPFIFEED